MASYTYPFSGTVLTMFNQYRQLCIYNTNKADDNIEACFVLLKTTSTVQRFVSLEQDGYNLSLTCGDAPSDLSDYLYSDYDFSDNSGQIWLDPNGTPSIVIGMGDLRNGIDTGELIWYRIPAKNNTTGQSLVLSTISPFLMRIYYKVINEESESVGYEKIKCIG